MTGNHWRWQVTCILLCLHYTDLKLIESIFPSNVDGLLLSLFPWDLLLVLPDLPCIPGNVFPRSPCLLAFKAIIRHTHKKIFVVFVCGNLNPWGAVCRSLRNFSSKVFLPSILFSTDWAVKAWPLSSVVLKLNLRVRLNFGVKIEEEKGKE